MRFEYIKAYKDNFVAWTIICVDAKSVEDFKEDFAKYYGKYGDYILAWRIANSGEEHIEKPELMYGRAERALRFFFHNDLNAAKEERGY